MLKLFIHTQIQLYFNYKFIMSSINNFQQNQQNQQNQENQQILTNSTNPYYFDFFELFHKIQNIIISFLEKKEIINLFSTSNYIRNILYEPNIYIGLPFDFKHRNNVTEFLKSDVFLKNPELLKVFFGKNQKSFWLNLNNEHFNQNQYENILNKLCDLDDLSFIKTLSISDWSILDGQVEFDFMDEHFNYSAFEKLKNIRLEIKSSITNLNRLISVEKLYLNYDGPINSILINSKKINDLTIVNNNYIDDNLILLFEDIPTLTLNRCPNIVNIPKLSSVKNLQLSNCDGIIDVSNLSDLINLDLSCCNIRNIETLGKSNIKTLNLSFCGEITDVSTLGNIKTLNLSHCNGIFDVSSLTNVTNLNLSYCKNITDVSALGNVKSLCLSGCDSITDVSTLGKVTVLDLSGCKNITDVSALGKVSVLDLSNCENITNVSDLGKVTVLDLSGCKNIKDVFALRNVYNLKLETCTGIESLLGSETFYSNLDLNSNLDLVYKNHILNLSGCINIHYFAPLSGVYNLDLSGCNIMNISDVYALRNVNTLCLASCIELDDISALETGTIENLDISSTFIKNISSLGNIKTLETLNLSDCHHIKDISCLKNIKNINLNLFYYISDDGNDGNDGNNMDDGDDGDDEDDGNNMDDEDNWDDEINGDNQNLTYPTDESDNINDLIYQTFFGNYNTNN